MNIPARWLERLRSSAADPSLHDRVQRMTRELVLDVQQTRMTIVKMPLFAGVRAVFSYIPMIQVGAASLARTARETRRVYLNLTRPYATDAAEVVVGVWSPGNPIPATPVAEAESVRIPARHARFAVAVHNLLRVCAELSVLLDALDEGLISPDVTRAAYAVASELSLLEAVCVALSREARILLTSLKTARDSRDALDRSLIAEYEARLAEKPDDWTGWLDLAEALISQKRLADADQAIARAFALQPDSSRAFYLSGVMARRRGHMHEAIEDLKRAVDLFADFAVAWAELARLLEQQGDVTGAMHAATQALHLEPTDSASRRLRNRVAHQASD